MYYKDIIRRAASPQHRQALIDELSRQLGDSLRHKDDTRHPVVRRAASGRCKHLATAIDLLEDDSNPLSLIWDTCGTFVVTLGAAGNVLHIDRSRLYDAATQWDVEHDNGKEN